MADSENSRTLPSVAPGKIVYNSDSQPPRKSINRKNLLSAATNLLASRTTALREQRPHRDPGPTAPAELWQEWFLFHQRRERITKLQQKLEGQVLAAAGNFPLVTVEIPGQERPVSLQSFAEIDRLKHQLNVKQVKEAKTELRRRRKSWKDADGKLGYSAALAFERELAQREGILARVLELAEPIELIEVTAKLHCLIAMEDPGLKHKEAPWPQLRGILRDLINIEQRRDD